MTVQVWPGFGPTLEKLEDESSLWHVRAELLDDYLEIARATDRRKIREVEGLVSAGMAGNKTISSSWLIGLRGEARNAAGLEAIPLDKSIRVVEGWPSEISSQDGIAAWALHQYAGGEAIARETGRNTQAAIAAAISKTCQACESRVLSVRAGLCDACSSVLEVARFRRAETLGREKVGRVTRLEAVERWLEAY